MTPTDTTSGRYSRQVLFPPIGAVGQTRIRQGRALLIGCGGLGSVIADILVRAGIGFLRIVDKDTVEESNLQRQVLFDTRDAAERRPKAEAARRKLKEINPDSSVEAIVAKVEPSSILDLAKDVDLILDGTDNVETRYLINDAAIFLQKPWIHGAAIGSTGVAMTIIPGRTPCLRCLYETPPPPGATPTCNISGIISPIVHIVASIQTANTLKFFCDTPTDVEPEMIRVDVWNGQYRRISMKNARNPACPACARKDLTFLGK